MSAGVVVLKRSGVRRLGTGHPWLFADQIEAAEATDGELVRLEGPVGRARGWAVLNAATRLALRVVSRDPGADVGPDFWRARLARAVARREGEGGWTGEDQACRWVAAEADGLPGLIVDRYGPVAVVQAGTLWADRVAGEVAAALVAEHGVSGVLARHDGGFRAPEKLDRGVSILAGEVPETVVVQVAGVERRVDPWHGQKTGLYLDQRENHRWAPGVLPVGRVLDAFCHEGGFSLPLARAGSEVVALDSSARALSALEACARDHEVAERITSVEANAFEELRARARAGEVFDAVVVDPPALAKSRRDQVSARRGYKELALRALLLLRPGGRLLACSCSFHVDPAGFMELLAEAAADAGVDVLVRTLRGAARCHPHLLTLPESAYLKVVLLERLG